MIMPTSIFIWKFYHSHLSAAQVLKRCADGFRVDVPHDLADVLLLASHCTVRLDTARFHNGLKQVFVERQRSQVPFAKRNQLLAEFLSGQMLAFPRAFAGLCIVH
jgi:hypothetical protein